MFLAWLALATRFILLVGERELDISFLEGVGVHFWLVISIHYGSREVLVPPGPVHLHALVRYLQGQLGCGHQPGNRRMFRRKDSGVVSGDHLRDLQFTEHRYHRLTQNSIDGFVCEEKQNKILHVVFCIKYQA